MAAEPSPVAPPGEEGESHHPLPVAPEHSPVAPAGEAEVACPLPQPAKPPSEHWTRVVDFFGRRTRIVCQGKNGSCPLFAICNFLLLKGRISLPDALKVSLDDLVSILERHLIDTKSSTKDKGEEFSLKQERNVEHALSNLQSLAKGLGLSPLFMSIDGYVSSPKHAIFDALQIPLYHGWIVDPQDTVTATAIGSKSFDALCDKIAAFQSVHEEAHKGRGDLEEEAAFERAITESASTFDGSNGNTSGMKRTLQFADLSEVINEILPSIADEAEKWKVSEFLHNRYLTQLTERGLCCLRENVKERELCVFFRNKHYNTMIKCDGRLYTLANQEAFKDMTDIIWQTLDEVNGAGVFVNSNFNMLKPEILRKKAEDRNAQLDCSTPGQLITIDKTVVDNFCGKKMWMDLHGYLGTFVASILNIPLEEAVMMHPGLFLILRGEILGDMLSDDKFEDAGAYFQSSLKPLYACEGKYVAFDLVEDIDVIATCLNSRSTVTRSSPDKIGTHILDYLRVYFPNCISWFDGSNTGIWQFAMKFCDENLVQAGFRCCVCGWVFTKLHRANHLRLHLLQSNKVPVCHKVSEDVLDRLVAVEGEDVIIEYLQHTKTTPISKRRSADKSSSGSRASGHSEIKRPRRTAVDYLKSKLQVMLSLLASDSDRVKRAKTSSSHTPSQTREGPSTSFSAHAFSAHAEESGPLLGNELSLMDQIVENLSAEASAILGFLRGSPPSVAAPDRLRINKSTVKLQKMCVDLASHEQVSQDLLSVLSSSSCQVSDDIVAVVGGISVVEDANFLVERAGVIEEQRFLLKRRNGK